MRKPLLLLLGLNLATVMVVLSKQEAGGKPLLDVTAIGNFMGRAMAQVTAISPYLPAAIVLTTIVVSKLLCDKMGIEGTAPRLGVTILTGIGTTLVTAGGAAFFAGTSFALIPAAFAGAYLGGIAFCVMKTIELFAKIFRPAKEA